MRHIILTGYDVGVVSVPPDNGGGRILQLGAQDRTELIEIGLTDETWDELVESAKRVHVAKRLPPQLGEKS
jgi:hypothetical protein